MCICISTLIEATEQSQDSRVVSVLQEVNYNKTSMHGTVPYKSLKLDQTNLNGTDLCEQSCGTFWKVQKYLVTDLGKEFGCPITAAHLSVLQETVRYVFLPKQRPMGSAP